MIIPLRQSTASQSIAIGPFVDDTDGKTPETALSIENTDIKIMVNGGASANKNSGGATHRVNGVYGITLDATDTATVGELFVSVVFAGALPAWVRCRVYEEAIFDAYYADGATGLLPANVTQISGDATAADTLELFAEALDQSTGQLNSGTLADGTITAASIATNAISNGKIANNAISSGKIATDAIGASQIAPNAITFAAIADGAIGTGKLGSNAITSPVIQEYAITATKIADGTLTSAKFASGAFDAVWSVTTRTLTTVANSAGITTLLSRITALIRTKAEDDAADSTIANAIPSASAVASQVRTELTTELDEIGTILAEVGKVPRGSNAIAAGGQATRTKVSADGTTLVETIS
jgi:hypothetical protein